MAGFSFANEKEALGFFTKVMTRESLRVAPKSRPQSTVAASASPAAAQQTSANNTSASGGGGLFGSGKKKKKKLDKSLIGAPSNFKHLTHVGYSQDSGYSVRGFQRSIMFRFIMPLGDECSARMEIRVSRCGYYRRAVKRQEHGCFHYGLYGEA